MIRRFIQLPVAVCVLVLATSGPGSAEVVTFQEGVNGYDGTRDVEFNAQFLTQSLGQQTVISVDESNGGFVTQGALRFEKVFVDEGGLVPRSQPILFAEIEFAVVSATESDAVVSFNRVLGADQNRRAGSGPWSEGDSWDSLGGDDEASGNPPVLEEKPIEVGPSAILGIGNEAIAAPESFDSLGKPRGILPRELNLLSTGNLVTIDVTDSLQAWQAGAPNLGWAINNSSTNGWDFLTSEWSLDALGAAGRASGELLLQSLDRTEFEVRPLLRVVFGVSGDLNLDGVVDATDYALFRSVLGNDYTGRGELGDLDFDRSVDLDDFLIFKSAFEQVHGSAAFAALVHVPEPACAGLALVGGLLLLRVRRRDL